MASHWNTLMEGLQRVSLTQHEQRVLAAIARRTLGFNKTEDRIAISQLQKATGLHRRHVSAALERLEARHILARIGGAPGRGNSATIKVNLTVSQWLEKSREEATLESHTVARHIRPEKSHHHAREKSHDGVTTRGKTCRGSTPPPTPSHADDKPIEQLARETYVAYGGSLENHQAQEALDRHALQLHKRGIGTDIIVAACRELGREHAFPGYLRQRAEAIIARGGPCQWDGLDHMALTLAQLRECGCRHCQEWINARADQKPAA